MSESAEDFPAFLMSQGHLSEVDAERVRGIVRGDSVPLGKVLVMSGMMSVKTVMQVMAVQAENPGERFGLIAMRLGFLTPAQLQDALRRQGEVRRHAAQVVLDLGLLEEPRWREALVAYCARLEARVP